MEEKLNLFQKIIEVRKCVPFLKKDETGYKYKYVAGVSVLSAIQGKMNELGLLLMPSVTSRQHHIEKEQRVVMADMVMTWIDAESGEKLEVPWVLFGEQNDISKAFGSGLTYSERYYLLKALNIPTDEDDPDAKKKPNKKAQPPINKARTMELSIEQWNQIKSIGAGKKLTENETKALVQFCAGQNKISPRSAKIAELMLPVGCFDKVFNEYLRTIEAKE